MSERNKPAMEIRLGAIKAAIWRNEGDSGVRYAATFSRLYREGEQWQTTESFGRDDLLLLAKVADQAHSWIFTQGREAAGGGRPGPSRGGGPGPGQGGEGRRGSGDF